MEEASSAERKVQVVAGLIGLAVAGAIAVTVGVNAGFSAGLAVFFLSLDLCRHLCACGPFCLSPLFAGADCA